MPAHQRSVALVNRLIYLDRSYISDLYEATTGESAATQITKNQGKKAGAALPVFSAELSAFETRSFSLSTLEMLEKALPELESRPMISSSEFKSEMPSVLGWVEGELSVFQASSSVQDGKTGERRVTASDAFFSLRTKLGATDLALITTPEYFFSGIDSFLRMQETLLDEMSIPVRAYVRVFAAKSHHKSWVAVPLVVLERK